MKDEHLIETCVEKNVLFQGKIIEVRNDTVRLPNGGLAEREVVDHCDGVTIAALNDRQELYFVRQYRYPHDEVVLELPAGKLDSAEDPLDGAIRELKEEVGVIGKDYRDLGTVYPSPGCYKENLHLFACRVDRVESCDPDEDEFLDVLRIPLQEAADMCLRNEIPDSKSIILILKLAMLVERGEF